MRPASDPRGGQVLRPPPRVLRVDHRRESYVLTTGTGSGKSMAYIVPIVDRVLRDATTIVETVRTHRLNVFEAGRPAIA